MMRLLSIFALIGALSAPVPSWALEPWLLTPQNCKGITASINPLGQSCFNGHGVGGISGLPLTFSRTSSGTATDLAGNIYTFATNVPRITNRGWLLEQASTNYFLNSATGATQTVSTTAASWTLSLYGTGSVIGAGSCTISLAGTGANNRVQQTITATSGSCVLTVTGSITSVQFEPLGAASSYIATTGSAATRAQDIAYVTIPCTHTPYTIVARWNYFIGDTTVDKKWFTLSDGTPSNRVFLDWTGSSGASFSYENAGSTTTVFAQALTGQMRINFATSYDGTTRRGAANGVAITPSAVSPIAVCLTQTSPEGFGGITAPFAYLQSLTLYSSAFTQSQLNGATQ